MHTGLLGIARLALRKRPYSTACPVSRNKPPPQIIHTVFACLTCHTRPMPPTEESAEPSVDKESKSLEIMRKFSEQYAKRCACLGLPCLACFFFLKNAAR